MQGCGFRAIQVLGSGALRVTGLCIENGVWIVSRSAQLWLRNTYGVSPPPPHIGALV